MFYLDDQKPNWDEISNFWPKSWINPYENLNISTVLNRYFLVEEGLSSLNWMISKHYFKAILFKNKQTKIPIFDQNHGLIPLEKSSFVTL